MTVLTPTAASELFRREPERFLDVGEGEIAYRRIGTGPDVLFVHGWPLSGATFRTLLPHLVDHVTCHLIDLPGSGSSRFTTDTKLSIRQHVVSVRRAVDLLELDRVAVVGHDSGGMIARHALARDPRVSGMGLINTEQSQGLSWRFKLFVGVRRAPGLGAALGWVAGQRRLRKAELVFGGAFADSSLLDGEFDEFFLQPLHDVPERRRAAAEVLRSFEPSMIRELEGLHALIHAPVQLVWGDQDPFFPLGWAQEMVGTFPDARLTVVEGAGLMAHEERPAEVAQALLPTLLGSR